MDWNLVKSFLAVAKHGSLNEAARHLRVSGTTTFRHLNHLEETVGTRLFERLRGRYHLTEAGEELLPLAQQMADNMGDIERKLAGRDIALEGKVTITAPTSFAYHWLPAILHRLQRDMPEITIDLLASNQEVNMSLRKADIALRVAQNPPDHLVGREIARIRWGAYASDIYLQRHGMPETVEDLAHHQVIGTAGLLQGRPAYDLVNRQSAAQIRHRSDDLVAIAALAAAGNGIALLPDDLQQPDLTRCFTVTAAGENRVWILTHPDLRRVARIKYVMRVIGKGLEAALPK